MFQCIMRDAGLQRWIAQVPHFKWTLNVTNNKRITELENKEAQLALKEKKATRKFID